MEEAPLPRSSPRYPAELSQFPDGLLHEAFRKLFRSHAAGGSIRRDSFINRVLGSNGAENRSKEPSGFLTGPWNDGGS